MSKFLLMDFGASRIKAALLDRKSRTFLYHKDFTPPPNIATRSGQYEISASRIARQFCGIVDEYLVKVKGDLKGILICSQMHGFILLNEHHRPITNYISWQDERSLKNIRGASVYGQLRRKLGGKFKAAGMKCIAITTPVSPEQLNRAGLVIDVLSKLDAKAVKGFLSSS